MLKLRPYQQEAIDALYSWFQSRETGNPLLVLPTGSGKSLIAARICEDALKWPNQRVLILTHVRELVEQNYAQLFRIWPEAPAGIYCAGLDRKQYHHPITFASIQSVYKKAQEINWRDLVIIDECHLLADSDSSMYRSFLSELSNINPQMKLVGLSATPYRLKSGYLHCGDRAMFSEIAYDLPLMRLIKEGYLAPLLGKMASTQGETSHLHIRQGEYVIKEVEDEFNTNKLIESAVKEMLEKASDRKSWLIFCITVKHAEHVRDVLLANGITAETVSEKTPKRERAQTLSNLKNGAIRAITNVGVLTTGFDAPGIDMICFLRPTKSPGLLVQMSGRGMRPVYAPGHDMDTVEGRLAAIAAGPKPNCLVLDMAGNFLEHGPITHIEPRDGSRDEAEESLGKECPKCHEVNTTAALTCEICGHVFEGKPRKIKHSDKAANVTVTSEEGVVGSVPTWLNVAFIQYNIHTKANVPASLKITYKTETQWILRWLSFGHPKEYPRILAGNWWKLHGGLMPVPATADEAMERLIETSMVQTTKIRVRKSGKYYEVLAEETERLQKPDPSFVRVHGNLGAKYVSNDIAF